MAINRETLRLQAELTLLVDDQVSDSVRRMTVAWVRAWRVVEREWQDVAKRLAAEGKAPSRRTLRRARNVQRALVATRRLLDQLTATAGVALTEATPSLLLRTTEYQARIIASQLPAGSDVRATVLRQAGVPNRQMDALTRRTAGQITSSLRPLTAEATETMLEQLLLGAARGQNPRAVARQMVTRVRDGFNGGLSRALVVSRTELLDAHRAGAQVAQNQHSDVLEGWQWLAKLGERTCPACWALHGSKHPADEAGPAGHQQCRCGRMPLTRSWRDLGIDIPEPPSLVRDGRAEFDRLPASRQLEVMGPTRLRMLKAGLVDWDELAQLRHNRGWRNSYHATPVASLNRSA